MLKKNIIAVIRRYAKATNDRKDPAKAFNRREKLYEISAFVGHQPSAKSLNKLKKSSLKYAKELTEVKNYQEAERIIEKTLQIMPEDPALLKRYAHIATAKQDWNKAYYRWLKVFELSESNGQDITEQVIVRFKKAAKKYTAALNENAEYNKAENVFNVALLYLPFDVQLSVSYADTVYAQNNCHKYLVIWNEIINKSQEFSLPVPQKSTATFKKNIFKETKKIIENHDYGTAEEALELLLSIYPDDIKTALLFAEVTMLKQDWQSALSRFSDTLQLLKDTDDKIRKKIDNKIYYCNIQLALEKKVLVIKQSKELCAKADYDQAEKILEDILKYLPDDSDVNAEYARIPMVKEDWEEAVKRWHQLLNFRNIKVLEIIIPLSNCYRRNGETEKAINILEGAINCELIHEKIYMELVRIYQQTGEWEKAGKAIDYVLKRSPLMATEIGFATLTARVYWQLGDFEQASKIIEKAVADKNIDDLTLKTKVMLREIRRRNKNNEIKTIEVSKFYYDEVYNESDKYQLSGEDIVYLPVWDKVATIVKQENIKNILDLGCGPGQFAQYLMGLIKVNYTGIDYSSVAIDTARLKVPAATFIESDIFDSQLYKEVDHDLIIMLEVLEHIENDLELLNKIPEGKKIIASVPNFDSFGHVRLFNSIKDVEERYEPVFSELQIVKIKIADLSAIYLMHGKK